MYLQYHCIVVEYSLEGYTWVHNYQVIALLVHREFPIERGYPLYHFAFFSILRGMRTRDIYYFDFVNYSWVGIQVYHFGFVRYSWVGAPGMVQYTHCTALLFQVPFNGYTGFSQHRYIPHHVQRLYTLCHHVVTGYSKQTGINTLKYYPTGQGAARVKVKGMHDVIPVVRTQLK